MNSLVKETEQLKPAFDQKNVAITFSVDHRYVITLAVSIESIIQNSAKELNYDIVILHRDISISSQQKIIHHIKNKKNISIRFHNVSHLVEKYQFNKVTPSRYVSIAGYYRLLIPEIFEKYDKIIYLDSDLVLLTDVSFLYQVNLEGKAIGAVKDSYVTSLTKENEGVFPGLHQYAEDILNLQNLKHYFNSGVLIFDIQKFKINNYLNELVRVSMINYKFFNDQNVLNSVLQGDTYLLPGKWNFQENNDPYNKVNNDTCICHFTGSHKPWNKGYKGKNDNLFWKYTQNSVYKKYLFALKIWLKITQFPMVKLSLKSL